MKQFRKLLVLLLVLVVCIGAYFAVTIFTKDPEPIAMEEIAVFTTDGTDLASISWDYKGSTVTLIQAGGAWQVEEDPNFPLDQSYAKVMVNRLKSVVALSSLTEFASDMSNYGLDEPLLTIRATKTSGETTTMSCGSYTSTIGGHYLKSDRDEARLHIVEDTVLKAFQYELYDLVIKEKLPTMSAVASLDVHSGDHQFAVRYFEDPTGMSYTDQYNWFSQNDDGTYSPASLDKIVNLASSVAGLTWQKCVTYKADDAAMKTYGLTQDAASRIEIGYLDEKQQEKSVTLLFGAYEGASCYARLDGSKMVYLVEAATVDPMLVANADTVMPDDVCLMNWADVKSMTISMDGKTYPAIDFEGTKEITSIDGTTSEKAVFTCQGKSVDSAAMQAVLDSLYAMQATETLKEAATPRGQVLSVTFVRNTQADPEMTLSFYQYNSSSHLVTFTNQPDRLVDSTAVATLLTQVKTVASSLS